MTPRTGKVGIAVGFTVHAALMLLAALGLLLSSIPSTLAQGGPPTIETIPVQPRAQHAVTARFHLGACNRVKSVRYMDGVIEITAGVPGCLGLPPPGLYPLDVSLGKFPEGAYLLRLIVLNRHGQPPSISERSMTVAGSDSSDQAPLLDYSGWWTTADADRGEGWLVEHKMPDRLILSWVTYDADGEPTWFNMQSTLLEDKRLHGPVYRSRRQGDAIVREIYGDGWFQAIGMNEAVFHLHPENPAIDISTMDLRRIPF